MNAVIFDFDRTLVNLGDFVQWSEAKSKITDEYVACGVSPEFVEKHQSIFALLTEVRDELGKQHSQRMVFNVQDRVCKILETYELMAIEKAFLMPGALEALKFAEDKKIKVGIVSSNSPSCIIQCMRRLGVLSYVDCIVGRGPRLRIKPYPDQVLLCLKKLKCKPENTVMIGDHIADLRSAKASGIAFIGVLTGRTLRANFESEKADHIIETLEELPQILQKLWGN